MKSPLISACCSTRASRGPAQDCRDPQARPSRQRGLGLKAGDIILAIDRTELTDKVNLSKLLNTKVNEMVLLEVTSNPADQKQSERLKHNRFAAIAFRTSMYDRWIEKNAEAVASSRAPMGYIHIHSMDDAGVEQFVRSLYSTTSTRMAFCHRRAANGGGFTHDQVLELPGAPRSTRSSASATAARAWS